MTVPSSEPPSFPEFRAEVAWPAFLLGWGLGAALLFGVRGLADALITDPCRGRTLIALLVPLLLGPGALPSPPRTGEAWSARRWGWAWWSPRCFRRSTWAPSTSASCAPPAARAATSS
ncbi:hypothetical protein ACXXDK_14140 [Deinococcus sp. PESE-38]